MIGRVGSTDEPEADRVRARLLFGGLLVLALGATVILVLSDSAQWLRVAVLAGLWAALLGALVAARYRGQAGARDNEVADLRELYELELEREVAARREFELELEAKSENVVSDGHATQMAELRAELSALRQQLEALMGGEVLVERLSLQAQATRMRALEGQRGDRPQRSIAAGPVVESPQPNGQQSTRAEPVAEPARNGSARQEPRRRAATPAVQATQATQVTPPVAAGRRPADAEATEYWQPFGDATAVQEPAAREPEAKPARRGDAELPRRQPGAATWPDPNGARGSGANGNRLDPNWTPSWEAEDALQWPSSSQSISRPPRRPAEAKQPRRQEPRQPERQAEPPRQPEPVRRQEAAQQPEPQRQPEPRQPERQPEPRQQEARQPEPQRRRPDPRLQQPTQPQQEPVRRPSQVREVLGAAEPGWAETPERTTRHAAPEAGGRRRKPDPEETRYQPAEPAYQETAYQEPAYQETGYAEPAGRRYRAEEAPGRHGGPAASNGRRHKPDEPAPAAQPAPVGGGRRRKPEEYADPELSAGFTIRAPADDDPGAGRHGGQQNGSSGGSHTQGLSVSELLAAHGNSGGGRRRRRED